MNQCNCKLDKVTTLQNSIPSHEEQPGIVPDPKEGIINFTAFNFHFNTRATEMGKSEKGYRGERS